MVEKLQTVIKKQRSSCVSLRRKNKILPRQRRKRGITTNKNFWAFIKPFLTNKEFLENEDITLIEGNKIITNEKDFAKTFNKYYIRPFAV